MIKTTDYEHEERAIYVTRREIKNEYFDLWRRETDYVATWHGIVFVSRYYNDDHEVTSMIFIWRGRDHMRSWKKFWGDRTITRLAREMVEEVVNDKVGGGS